MGSLATIIATGAPGGTLTVSTWDRTIASQYYVKSSIKFTTATGEVWGPVETIHTL